MKQHEGFVDLKLPNHVCLLKKTLYGLKQYPIYTGTESVINAYDKSKFSCVFHVCYRVFVV